MCCKWVYHLWRQLSVWRSRIKRAIRKTVRWRTRPRRSRPKLRRGNRIQRQMCKQLELRVDPHHCSVLSVNSTNSASSLANSACLVVQILAWISRALSCSKTKKTRLSWISWILRFATLSNSVQLATPWWLSLARSLNMLSRPKPTWSARSQERSWMIRTHQYGFP